MILKLIYYKKVIESNFQKLPLVLHFFSSSRKPCPILLLLLFCLSVHQSLLGLILKRILGLVDPRTSGICISFAPAGLVDSRTEKP